jgi:cyclopropane fatty-acyl-phospholipid synthase-like methyltransferase
VPYLRNAYNCIVRAGDITDLVLPAPYADKTFDFIMLNDVAEHIQKERYGCFFRNLHRLTHEGSIVYMHTPTPQAQLADSEQYVENVLPHHVVVTGMALAGFELVTFEHDLTTVCVDLPTRKAAKEAGQEDWKDAWKDTSTPQGLHNARCVYNKWPKYYHVLFRKSRKEVLVLS